MSALTPCLGISALGSCAYDPASPANVYFSLGEAVGALAFTLTVQQLLKPIYRFRLSVRYLPVAYLYLLVFAGVGFTFVAAIIPSIPDARSGPWGYPIVWEMAAAVLFMVPYAAVVMAIVRPIRVNPKRIGTFAQGVATILSSATEQDHADLMDDLQKSLPRLIREASFIDELRDTTAFFDFLYRHKIQQAAYAASLLRIIEDPPFCRTLVRRVSWPTSVMLGQISREQIHSRAAEGFVQELAHQAILNSDSMLAREVDYAGFGTAPLLSESLFSDPFIVGRYDPLENLRFWSEKRLDGPLLKRFNSAAQRCYLALIQAGKIYNVRAAHSLRAFYRSLFSTAYRYQQNGGSDHDLVFEMRQSVQMAVTMANKLLSSVKPCEYQRLFVSRPDTQKHDVLETLVEVIFDALTGIANKFEGPNDLFWSLAIDVISHVYPRFGTEPDGLTPFQQRLALKIVRELKENMRGFYPALSRVMLATIGPYHHDAAQPNSTAFNILKDAIYIVMKVLPKLAERKPDEVSNYLPEHVSYLSEHASLVHTFRGGSQRTTELANLRIAPISLLNVRLRRTLTEHERQAAALDFF